MTPQPLTSKQIDWLFEYRVLPEYERAGGFKKSSRPTLILLGGQPGAGKSTLHAAVAKHFEDAPPVTIEGDHFREFHPQFTQLATGDPYTMATHTADLAGGMSRRVMQHAVAHRSNIVFETTLRQPDAVSGMVEKFRSNGYAVQVFAIAVKREFSELGIQHRFEMLMRDLRGRYTLTEVHDAAYMNVPVSLDRLQKEGRIDALHLFSRDQQLYQNFNIDGKWSNPLLASQIITQERLRQMAPEEVVRLSLGWETVNMKRMERDAPAEEFARIADRVASASRRVILDPKAWAIHAESHPGLLAPDEDMVKRLRSDELLYTRHLYLRGAIGLPEAQTRCCQVCGVNSLSIKEQASLNAVVLRFLNSPKADTSMVINSVAQRKSIVP